MPNKGNGNGRDVLTDSDDDLTPVPDRFRNADLVRVLANLRLNVDQRLRQLCVNVAAAPEPFPSEMLPSVVGGLRDVRDEFSEAAVAVATFGDRKSNG